LPTFVPFTSGISLNTTVYSELTATTSLVAAEIVTATSTPAETLDVPGTATGTSSGGVVMQTTNAGAKNLPGFAAAAVGAMAFML
jgi:hypothetical protein